MNCPNSYILNIDWFQVLLEIFASVLGFGLAILGERISDNIKSKKDAKELKKIIIEEIKSVYDTLKLFSVDTLDSQPLKISSWESACSTGQLALLDMSTRNCFFNLYNGMKEFNSWSLVQTNYYFEKGELNLLIKDELTRIKEQLLEEIYSNIFENGSLFC